MKRILIICCALGLLLSACADRYEDEQTWTSNVQGVQLESPKEINYEFSPDGTSQTVRWSLVSGASGYEVSVYNVDGAEPVYLYDNNGNLVKNMKMDGFSITVSAAEDSRYEATVRALGNEEKNNTEAAAPTKIAYNNLLFTYKEIPSGENLTDWFTANPIPQDSTIELVYDLAEGGTYTMSGNINIGKAAVTIRGFRGSHPKVDVTDGSFVSGGGKFMLKFVDLDYTGFTGTATSNGIVIMGDFAAGTTPNDKGYVIVPSIAVQSCKITKNKGYIFWDGGKKYALGAFLIKDCILGHSTSSFSAALMRWQSGMVKDLTITQSTLYNDDPPTTNNNQRFIQISSGNLSSVGNPDWSGGNVNIISNTMWQMSKYCDAGNSNGAMRAATDRADIQKNVFVDCFGQTNVMWNMPCRTPLTQRATVGQNTQWWGGESLYSRAGSNEANNDWSYLNDNPQLTYLGNGEFTMDGMTQQAMRTGDPRWLPAAAE